jgi:membrane-bound toxin of toxin-antitoxin system
MSNAREAPALRIELCASRQLTILLSAGHIGAFAIGAMLAVSTPGFGLLCIAVVLGGYRSIVRHALLRSSRSIVALVFDGERSCALRTRAGHWIYGEISASSYVAPWLIVLQVALERRRLATRIVLCADSMLPESHRRLRARLRWVRYGGHDVDPTGTPL